jgi:thymidylate kinase
MSGETAPLELTAVTPRNRRARCGLTVALVGPDGAGKSTLCSLLNDSAGLPFRLKTIYMGVNLEASSLMLPTTRALLVYKRLRGRRPDLVASPPGAQVRAAGRDGPRRTAKNAARLTVWTAEEWLRQLVALWYRTQGYVVVFDRHFFADYYQGDVDASRDASDLPTRVHVWMLDKLYPKPDLVVCLDAPAEVLYARKHEATPAWLAARRQQYLALADVVPAFERVDASQPLDAVLAQVVDLLRAAHKGRSS